MRNNGYQRYFEEELREASPLKLVVILYRGALDAIVSARRYVRLGEIRPRARDINRAIGILAELSRSLDRERGGEVSRNLARLYAYIRALLVRANSEQREEPLVEAERLLNTVLEGWMACQTPERTTQSPQAQPGAPPEGYRCAESLESYRSAVALEC
jgi:flagellar secretion chaperone FliS